MSDIADAVFVDLPKGTPGRLPSDLAFRKAAVYREVAFEAMSAELILSLARQNLVIAMLPPATLTDISGLRAIPLADGPTRVECLAWSSFNPTPAALKFIDGLTLG